MNTILFQAYAAMSSKMQALSIVANNLANANSVGYKADRVFDEILQYLSAYPEEDAETKTRTGVPVTQQQGAIDWTPGPVLETGNPLHVALLNDGFFAVQTDSGTRYTRQGDFQVGSTGQLQTAQGMAILGESGPIILGSGETKIDSTGHISVSGVEVGRLSVVRFREPQRLVKEGSSLFNFQGDPKSITPVGTPVIKQGALESSNVNVMAQLTELMILQREFESLQRTIQLSMNDMTQRLIDEVSKK